MKTVEALTTGLLLLSGVLARVIPYDEEGDDPEPLESRQRVTAFVIDENNMPSIECWEVGESHMAMSIPTRNGTSTGRASAISLGSSSGNLNHVSVETYESHGQIFPAPESKGVHADFLFVYLPCLFGVQSGMVTVTNNYFYRSDVHTFDDDYPDHTFSLENGDDWFYFEDKYTGSDDMNKRDEEGPPFTITSESNRNSQLLRIAMDKTPKSKKKLHNGPCGYNGVSVPESSSSHSNRIKLNLNIQEL